MPTTNLGRVAIVPQGAYSAAVEYKKLDLVNGTGGAYLYVNDTPSTGTALTDTDYWQNLVGNGITSILRTTGDGSPGTTDTYTIAYTDATTATFDIHNGEDTSDALANSLLWRKTASGNPVSIYPVPESPLYPKVSGTFTQEGTGDPSPENIRPITPWLANGATAKVVRTGKNLLPPLNIVSGTTISGVTFTKNADGSWTLNGTATDYIYAGSSNATKITLIKGVSYWARGNAGWQGSYLYMTNFVGGTINAVGIDAFVTTFGIGELSRHIIPNETLSAEVYFFVRLGDVFNNFIVYPQISVGSVATPYEPYSGTEISLTAPQEIAAGWMDNEGQGQVTHGYIASYVDETVPAGWVSSIGELSAGAQVVYPLAIPIDLTPTIAPLSALAQTNRITPRQNVLTATPATGIELTYAKSPIRESDEIAAAIAAI